MPAPHDILRSRVRKMNAHANSTAVPEVEKQPIPAPEPEAVPIPEPAPDPPTPEPPKKTSDIILPDPVAPPAPPALPIDRKQRGAVDWLLRREFESEEDNA